MASFKSIPSRAEHVGSFLRPDKLRQAARRLRAGEITHDDFVSVQDECIRDIVKFQEDIGLGVVTDGEFRRRSWSAGFFDAVEGFGLRDGTMGFHDDTKDLGIPPSPYAEKKIQRVKPIVANEFKFLNSITDRVAKATMPAPDVLHYFLGPRSVDDSAYPDIEEYFADLIAIYQQEINELAQLGCRYVQIDDTALACNCDKNFRHDVVKRGENPDQLTERYIKLANEALSVCSETMLKSVHLCRGNLKGAWMAEGGYEPVAEQMFGELNVDLLLLEYDSERSGDFSPLRFVPENKTVVLGLISTKTPALEDPAEIKRRIDQASQYVPLERLALSPQCGFGSTAASDQPITHDDERRKLELIVNIVRDVWGAV